jgi:hypothetical protein
VVLDTQAVVQGLQVVVVAAGESAHRQVHTGWGLGGVIGDGNGGGVEGKGFALYLLLSIRAQTVRAGPPYRLEDADGIPLANIMEQQVRANQSSKAGPYYRDPLTWLFHAKIGVDVSCVELWCCCLLGRHDGQTSNRRMSSAAARLQSQNRHRPPLPNLIANANW